METIHATSEAVIKLVDAGGGRNPSAEVVVKFPDGTETTATLTRGNHLVVDFNFDYSGDIGKLTRLEISK